MFVPLTQLICFLFSLGLQYRFDVIHDDGDSELEIGEHFLARMRRWKIMRGKK